MEHQRFVWFDLPRVLGQEAVDLAGSRRYIIQRPEWEEYTYWEAYYWMPGGRWFKEVEYEELDGEGYSLRQYRSECDPQDVIYAIVSTNSYGGQVPQQLEEYIKFGTSEDYHRWREENPINVEAIRSGKDESRPSWQTCTLYYKGIVCRSFQRSAHNQHIILNAFEDNNWKNPVRVNMHKDTLAATVKQMNQWDNPVLRFSVDKGTVTWRPKEMGSAPNSS